MATKINPQMNDNPDWSEVLGFVRDYIDDLNDPDTVSDNLSDYEAQIFEAVIEACFGAAIWDQINPILNEK